MRLLFLAIVFIFGITMSCNKSESFVEQAALMTSQQNDIYHEWVNVFLELDRYASFYRPGPAPRALAYMGLSAYEACLGGMPDYQSLQYRLGIKGMPTVKNNLYWPEVINASYAYLMRKFFETVTFKDKLGNVISNESFMNIISDKELELKVEFQKNAVEPMINNSESHGREVAAAIWSYSTSDPVGHNAHLNPFPVPVNAVGCEWVPTDPGVATRGLYSQWGKVRRFALTQTDLDALATPFDCSADVNSQIYAQAYETYVLTNEARKAPKGDLEHQAEFWSDDRVGWTFSPPGRMIAIADQIVEKENFDLEKTCVLYAQLGMAENDAAVNAWYNKYKFNIERPITYIQRNIDPKFTIPWLGFTPPFPAYPSGHSTMGGAAAEVLTADFGIEFPMYDRCHEGRTEFIGRPRFYPNFYLMAEENAYSRIPLGVHWRMDCKAGIDLGYVIGRKVNKLPFK